ncbi:MAG: T9SS type A sorting domain-containing protein [bacterium]|nr:T9SS type A sorting domain-containing protein [bacterium]
MWSKLIASLLLLIAASTNSFGQDSLNVSKIGQVGHAWEGIAHRVFVSGNYAYVAANEAGLRILDITDPANPAEVGYFDTPGEAYNVFVTGGHAYLANYFDGLYIIDVTDPVHPALLGHWDDSDFMAYDVVVNGPYAYLAYYGADLIILDVSNPAHPVEVGGLSIPGAAWGVDLQGDLLYIAGNGLFIVDISHPTAPVLICHPQPNDPGRDVTVSGNYAYLVEYQALSIIDVSDPYTAHQVSYIPTDCFDDDLATFGDYAYLANSMGGLRVLDVSDHANPVEVASVLYPIGGVATIGDYTFATSTPYGLISVDTHDPTQPFVAGGYTNWEVTEVAVSGNYAYLSDELEFDGNMRIIDVSDPAHPNEVSIYDITGFPCRIRARDNYLYIADGDSGLRILDVTNPVQPVEIGIYDTPEYASDLILQGNYAYLTGGWSLRIIDISNPSNPLEVGYANPVAAQYLAVSGDYVYVSWEYEYDSSLTIIDVSDPAHPAISSRIMPWGGLQMEVSGNYLYASCRDHGLKVYDLTNPVHPRYIATFNDGGWVESVHIVDNFAYVGEGYGNPGIVVLNVSNPAMPRLIGKYSTQGDGKRIITSNQLIYAVDGATLGIYQFQPPAIDFLTTPVNPPIVIPGNGGSFQFNVTVSNQTTHSQIFDAWIMTRLPDQTWYGPLSGPISVPLPANGTMNRLRGQTVPASAPAGIYWYEARIGYYPSVVIDSSGFAFTKLSAGNGPIFYEWESSDETVSLEIGEVNQLLPAKLELLPPSPNPFNPTTTLSFTLPHPARVSLEVFDINGRIVRAQHAAPLPAGPHEWTFDGSDLPSGIYFARLTAGEYSSVQKLVLLK